MKIKAYYDKGNKKVKKIIGRFIPHNTQYKPAGVCRINLTDLAAGNPREITVHNIYPNYVTNLNISDDLYAACNAYWKPKRQIVTDYMVVEAPNGRIYTDNESSVAVVTQYNRVVENVSLSLVDGKVMEPNLNNIFEQRYFTVPTRFNGTVFSMLTGGAGINNISHWFIDVLPRLHLLRESGLYDKVDWFYVPSLRYSYQAETLELLGIPKDKIITGDTHPHISADCVIASTAPRGNHTLIPLWMCDFIKNSFMPFAEEDGELPIEPAPYLYISRSDSSIRNVLNEEELLGELKHFGFKNVVSSQLSIKEKIKLFSRAEVVVGATGAGLINMFFCQPNTKLVEIFNDGFVLEPFYDIAEKIDLDYSYLICKGSGKVRSANQGMHEHLMVDIPRVVDLLKHTFKDKEMKRAETAA